MIKRANTGSTRQLLGIFIILQLFWCRLWGLDPNKSVHQYLLDHWQMHDGIPANNVPSINQTPDGYLWIGTSRGLVRFDGVKFVVQRFAEKEEIYSHEIRCLFVDRQGSLWIGSSVGLTLYNPKINRFKIFTTADGIANEGIRCIIDDMKGNTWISFDSTYVNRFSNGKFTSFNESHGLSGKRINAVVEDSQGNLLFATRENGIFSYKDEKFFKYPVPGLDNIIINIMYEDGQGELWIGTNKGLVRLTSQGTRRYTARDGLSNDWIISITQDSDRNLWVGTAAGLNRIKKKPDGSITRESLLKSYMIYWLFEDREKNLWIGTGNSGIIRLKDGKFMSYAPIKAHPGEIPLSLFEDRHGDTWIGTLSGKLLRCRGSKFIESIEPLELTDIGIASIAEDSKGNLWLGTIGKGVFQKKNNTFTQFTTRQGLADNMVTSIFVDSRDNLWFSTYDGVSVLRPGNNTLESLQTRDGLSGKRVYNVYEDKTNNIWIAADKGITILKNGEFAGRSMIKYLQDIPVTCIYEDADSSAVTGSIFWIATRGAGLKRFKHGNFFSYTIDHGLTTNFIYQFLEDPLGNFWLMSDSGVLRVSKSELNRFVLGSADIINCTSFGISDGLKSLEFSNEVSRNSVLKAGNSEFRFITRKGISTVNPTGIRINKTPPPVVIEAVYFNEHSILRPPDAEPVTFKGTTDLSFHFTALTFLSPEKVKFKYRIEGYDREWIYLSPGKERAAHYKDLTPGTYSFQVTACNADGVWNQKGDSVTFTLKPFFYQTLVFKLAVLFLLIALLAAAFYIYKKRPFRKKPKYKDSPLHPDFAQECIKKLNYLMENEKVYTDADISLQSLAEKMSIAPHQLSQVLNERLDRNFPDFINFYRIEEAKRILKSPQGAQQKIDTVAFQVGFNTTVAFYRAFKKYTNTTPTHYKKETGMTK
jgi:ligand-binding sensor domain-containing protein/AraC-like DNA-binding protein